MSAAYGFAGEPQAAPKSAEQTIVAGIAFLSREVPAWRQENGCYSCHNNGDGARALYAAKRLGQPVDAAAIQETTQWLRRPERWESNRDEAGASGPKLATIQFAAALLEAIAAGEIEQPRPKKVDHALLQAARLVAAEQDANGSWTIGAKGALGSPVTYGNYLATASALRVLSAAAKSDEAPFRQPIQNAKNWLLSQHPKTVLDAAATILGLAEEQSPAAGAQRQRCLDLITSGENKAGGWGPYATSGAEPFDTAVVLLALSQLANESHRPMIQRGSDYLIATQLAGGAWPETTRPANNVSYAQRVSTAAWAVMALQEAARFDK